MPRLVAKSQHAIIAVVNAVPAVAIAPAKDMAILIENATVRLAINRHQYDITITTGMAFDKS